MEIFVNALSHHGSNLHFLTQIGTKRSKMMGLFRLISCIGLKCDFFGRNRGEIWSFLTQIGARRSENGGFCQRVESSWVKSPFSASIWDQKVKNDGVVHTDDYFGLKCCFFGPNLGEICSFLTQIGAGRSKNGGFRQRVESSWVKSAFFDPNWDQKVKNVGVVQIDFLYWVEMLLLWPKSG